MISIPGKIPIRIFPFFWLLIFIIGWLSSETITGTVTWAVVILFSILVHEYGHALTALAFGQKAEIDLVGLGGLTRRTGAKIKAWQEFLIVLNGPFAGFLLFVLVTYLQPLFGPNRFVSVAYALKIAAYVNLVWNFLNLIPVQPLDGGHLLRIILEGFFGLKGIKISFFISLIIASLLSLFFFLIQAFLAGALFLMMAFESFRAWTDLKTITPQDTNDQLKNLLKEAQEDIQAGRQHEAFSKLTLLREQAKEGVIFVMATQYLARIVAQQGDFQQAYDLLLPSEYRLSADYLHLLQQLAFRLQKWDQVIRIGNRTYQEEPRANTALLNALSYAIMGQAKQSAGWLQSALHAGLPQIKEIIQKREFDAIRDTPEFQSFLRQINLQSK
jgi:stage IV sporulation protein FB